jgi:diadenosine tetraphosphate (Ap4A) HIT family hydrolase
MSSNDPVFYDLPSGMRAVAGGTRTEIKLNRPWQTRIEPNPETCPFCTGKGKIIETTDDGEWHVLQNLFTPYPHHHMVIPK